MQRWMSYILEAAIGELGECCPLLFLLCTGCWRKGHSHLTGYCRASSVLARESRLHAVSSQEVQEFLIILFYCNESMRVSESPVELIGKEERSRMIDQGLKT